MVTPNKEDAGRIAFKCVVVNGWAADYAIYVGPEDWSQGEIALHGHKLMPTAGEAIARDLPFLEHQWYERAYRK